MINDFSEERRKGLALLLPSLSSWDGWAFMLVFTWVKSIPPTLFLFIKWTSREKSSVPTTAAVPAVIDNSNL